MLFMSLVLGEIVAGSAVKLNKNYSQRSRLASTANSHSKGSYVLSYVTCFRHAPRSAVVRADTPTDPPLCQIVRAALGI